MKKYLIAITSITLIIILTWLLFVRPKDASPAGKATTDTQINTPPDQNSKSDTTKKPSKIELTIGNPSAPVTIIEYGDYKCPSCNQFLHKVEPELRTKYIDTGKAKLVFRNVPYIADDSLVAAEASYCANDQSKFSAFHNGVFNFMWDTYYAKGDTSGERQNVLTAFRLSEIGKKAGLDETKLRTCIENRTFKDAVSADRDLAEADKADGTPFFVIGDQVIRGPQPIGVFSPLIDRLLK